MVGYQKVTEKAEKKNIEQNTNNRIMWKFTQKVKQTEKKVKIISGEK